MGGFTLVVGTPSQPHNLFIAGSTAAYTNNVALETSGNIIVSYWGHDVPTSLVSGIFTDQSGVYVDASLLALGAGQTNATSSIATLPTSVAANPAP